MATWAVKSLAQVPLGAALGVVYAAPTAPPNAQAVLKSLWICNTDAATRLVTLLYGPGSLTAADAIMFEVPIPGKTAWYIDAADTILTMAAGTTLSGYSDVAGKVIVTVSGEEVT